MRTGAAVVVPEHAAFTGGTAHGSRCGFTVHDNGFAAGFTAQRDGYVPFGVGLELRALPLVASARWNYAYEFGTAFSPFDNNPLRYQGMLSFGTAF